MIGRNQPCKAQQLLQTPSDAVMDRQLGKAEKAVGCLYQSQYSTALWQPELHDWDAGHNAVCINVHAASGRASGQYAALGMTKARNDTNSISSKGSLT